MEALAYVVLKTVSSLMDDWNVVSNAEFFMLFWMLLVILRVLCCFAQALIFFVLKILVNVPFFTQLALLDLKEKYDLIRKFLSWGLEKKRLKV